MSKNRIGFNIGDMDEDPAEQPSGALKQDDIVLMQLIESIYKPAGDWPVCTTPLTTEQIVQSIMDAFPGRFEERNQVTRLLLELHVPYAYNEHNGKRYWLVNPAQ